MKTALSIHFAPLLPLPLFWVMAALAVAFLTLALFKHRHGAWLRALTITLCLLFLANPSLVEEQREPIPDTAIIVRDQSPSQKFGTREARSDQALAYLKEKLGNRKDLNLKIITASEEKNTLARETRLFESLDRALLDIPVQRRAGVIFLSDGQVHDMPSATADLSRYSPVHLLLNGDKTEQDRRVIIKNAAPYGLVGQKLAITYMIEQTGASQDPVTVTLRNYDGGEETFDVIPNTEEIIDIPIEHAGQNVFELSVAPMEHELTQANNRAALIINGVRDRLKVLLVSGQPHAGARLWRDMLTADPGVDLVHFTILREPEKIDPTPQNEMSLIAFPFRELFEVKLYDFDLIIFDRYKLNGVMPDLYFENIARYVREGGALLEINGPDYAGDKSVYKTALSQILPGAPTGTVLEKSFLPRITEDGAQHPVTRSLIWKGKNENGDPVWGHWLRQTALNADHGDILMRGADDLPLLILNRIEKGRVAQLASDEIWLWARGYEGGGPYAELMRRTMHWLMKEPELDEKALTITVEGDDIRIHKQNFKDSNTSIAMTRPDGSQQILQMTDTGNGLEAHEKATQLGIYSFEDTDGARRFALIGDINPPELRDVLTTSKIFDPLIRASKGSVQWLADTPRPNIRLTDSANIYGGKGWIALRQNHDYAVTGVKDRPVLPAWAAAIILLSCAILAWWREGRL